jgi:hypothetical protein
MSPPRERRFHDFVRCRLKKLDWLARIKFLAMVRREHWLVVPQIALAGGTGHVKLHHPLRPCRMMKNLRSLCEFGTGEYAIVTQHAG